MAMAWSLLRRMLGAEGRPRWVSAAGLGAALGLGLLTKAFFLPIGAGIGVVLLAQWLAMGRRPAILGQAVLAGGIALAIGGWWYVSRRLQTGSFSGSDEFIRLQQAGGFKALAQSFDGGEFLHGLGLIASSFVWGGTWSGVQAPAILLAAPVALLAVLLVDDLRGIRLRRPADWAPLALLLPMLAGLVYHVFVWMAGAAAETPGWYLHILAAPLGFALARGWRRPRLLAVLLALTAISTAVAWSLQLSLFSGCAAKLGSSVAFGFAGADCFVSMKGLAALGSPALGLASLAAGVALAMAAAVLAAGALRPRIP
jgi:hypothetical protein